MASHLTKDQVEEYRVAFSVFDKDGNSRINTGDLGNVMRALGQTPTEAEIRDMIIEADPDKNGTIEFLRFINVMDNKMMDNETMHELDEAFKLFDEDRDGVISKSELGHVMKKLGENLTGDDLDEMIKEFGVNDDNRITYEEVVKIMKAKRKRRVGTMIIGGEELCMQTQSHAHVPGFRFGTKPKSSTCRIQ